MAERRRWFGRGRTRALLAVGMLVGSGAVATSAYWSNAKTVPGVALKAGVINIDLASNVKVKPETYAWTALSGNIATAGGSQAQVLKVANNSTGALKFSYTISATATNNTLGNALKVTVLKGGTVSGSTCTGGSAVGAPNATLAGFTATVGTLLSTAASPFDNLCVQVTLPSGSGVAANATAAVSFTFSATQVFT